jgi:AcrR family transcriptional regulator
MPRARTVADDDILDATLRAIGQVGPDRLTLADIAREVGLAPATLLQRFGSKHDLLRAVAHRHANSSAPLATDAAIARSPLGALIDGLAARTALIHDPAAYANHLAFLQLDLRDPELLGAARSGARRLRSQIADLLRAAIDAGELRPCDVTDLAIALEVTYNGALLTWAVHQRGTVRSWVRKQLRFALSPWAAS